ncbi:MAG: hypothetical protein M3Y87_34090 [Myxococcota bacterium]|nr:hypothetical protein [Myxococcota bacterium]
MRSSPVLAMLAASVLLVACDDTVVVQLQTGRQPFELGTSSLALPTALRDDSGAAPRIAVVSCGPMGMCPSADAVPITCEAGLCDPAPRTISTPIDQVVDFDVLAADARSLLRRVETIEVLEARYEIVSNTITIDVPEIEIFWGPEGANDVDPAMGVVLLGVVPPIPARSSVPGMVALDPAGVGALSDYLVGTSRRVRFFARTRVDLAPGGAYPEGSIQATVDLRVRITGSIAH